ncbi:hypothetical protein SBADM41S_00430 [Streptomyces badius]
MRSISSIMPRTRDGAPPCSGPDIAPTAPDRAAATSAPVEAMTRAVNVEAFMPCSAAEVQYASTAFTCFGSGSPRQRIMNRSTTDCALSISLCGTIGRPWPRADWATYDRAITAARARSSRAVASSMSSSGFRPQTGASIASADWTSTRMSPECTGIGNGSAGGRPGLNAPSTSRPHTFPNETWPTRSSMSTPR